MARPVARTRAAAGRVRIGVSGWSYDAWRGRFYPSGLPSARRLSFLAERFDTVEANGSFYSLLGPATYRKWYDEVPSGFRIALKGSRFITHNKKLADVRGPLANFFASGVLALGEKLGPLVWQLAPRHAFRAERLSAFLKLLPRDTHAATALAREHDERVRDPLVEARGRHRLRHVLEPRHESFFADEPVAILRRAGVALAVSHSGSWPMREEITAGFVYVRLHGSRPTYAGRYSDAELDAWADKIAAWSRGGVPEGALTITDRAPPRRKTRDVYVYFDNDAAGHAPFDAERLVRRVRERS
ncbi:MAG TPA: DUF72 domain-containing protein [Longimicrobiales bacterium]|nr:DUF72 domain-containing protein [Longimicrobiales bacterium]